MNPIINFNVLLIVSISISITFIISQGAGYVYGSPDWGTGETDWGTGETDWPVDMNTIKPQQQEKDIKVINKTCYHYLKGNPCKKSYMVEDGNVIYHVKIKHRHMNH